MKQNRKKKCLKGGYHQNRDIQALCLQQPCRSDRLLCFYCIHQKHENHQIIYLLEGLDSPIEKLNINSGIQNKQMYQKYLQKKIKKINHGWKSLYRLFETYISKIQKNLEPQIAIIQQSFDENSAKNFAQIITNVNTTPETIDKYVQKIKLIMKYNLGDIEQVKLSTSVAYEELKQMYKTANEQIQSIMGKIVKQANLFSMLDFNFSELNINQNRPRLGIDEKNRVNISVVKDKTTVNSFENRFQGKLLCKKTQNRWVQKRNEFNRSKQHLHQQDSEDQIENSKQKIENSKQQIKYSNYKRSRHLAFREELQKQNSSNEIESQYQKINEQLNIEKADINNSGQKNENKNKYSSSQSEAKGNKDDKNHFQQQENDFQEHQSLVLNKIVDQNRDIQKQEDLPINFFQQEQQKYRRQIKLRKLFSPPIKSQQPVSPQKRMISDPCINRPNKSPNFSFWKEEFYQNSKNSSNYSNQQILQQKIETPSQQQMRIQEINQEQYPRSQPDQSSFQQQSALMRYRNYDYSQSQEQISPASINLKQIILNFSSLGQIQHYLNKIAFQSYPLLRSLQIMCDTLPLAINQNILKLILNATSLRKLVICQAYGLKNNDLKRIINSLPQLEHLVLEQSYSLNQELCDLMLRKLKKLKKFHYTSDTLTHLSFKEHNNEFMSEVDGFTRLNVISKLTDMPLLETIAFENIFRISEIKNNLLKMKKISELSIIFHQKQYKVNPVIQMLSQLNSAIHITHLELKQCYLREGALIQVINNCKSLKSFSLNKCRDITNETIEALSKHKNHLKQLDFMEQDEITGEGFQHFLQLQILSLKACWQIEETLLGQNIEKLTKLKCLNLNFNRYWLTQQIFTSISVLKNIELLVIDNNKINFDCLIKIKNLANLQTLACGNTELTAEDIIKFLSATKSQIKKLSLKREVYEQKSSKNQINNRPLEESLIGELSRLTPELTHLNIKGMKRVRKQNFQNLKNLKCLSSDVGQLDEETINMLQDRDVSLYIGYSHFAYDNQKVSRQSIAKAVEQNIAGKIKLEK